MIAMHDLGLEYIDNTSDYNALRTQIYEYYGVADILGQEVSTFNFPQPLQFIEATDHAPDIERFFKHLLCSDARTLLSYVKTILATEHKNSPIFSASASLSLDRETLAQLVDRAHRLAIANGAESSSNTRALINALTLMELLVW